MNEEEILERLYKYSRIHRLNFFFETEEYKYVCSILDGINVVLDCLLAYKKCKQNLRLYKDDKESCDNIKESMAYNKERLNMFLSLMEETYQDHIKKEENL